MNKKLLVKLCLLNFGIAIVNIFAFSDAFMGIILSEDTRRCDLNKENIKNTYIATS